MCKQYREWDMKTKVRTGYPTLHAHRKGETPTECTICQMDNILKVRDHNHETGKYRGCAHRLCNLQYNVKLVVMVHNLRGYDSHFLAKKTARQNMRDRKQFRKVYEHTGGSGPICGLVPVHFVIVGLVG